MSDKKDPFTYSKTFKKVVTLKITSQHSLETVTDGTVSEQIKQRLRHNDTITDVAVTKVEDHPSVTANIFDELTLIRMRLEALQSLIEGE